MTLTFLNLVVVTGILVGLIQGSVEAERRQYTSDLLISALDTKSYIENSPQIISFLRSLPQVSALSPRYLSAGQLEANYQTRTKASDKPNTAVAQMEGIDPTAENQLTGLSKYIISGQYLSPTDVDQVLLGSLLVKNYSPVENPGFTTLENVAPGTKILLTVNGVTRELTVKGILKSKVNEIGQRVYMVDSQLRNLLGREDNNVGEIAVSLKPGVDPTDIKKVLISSGFDSKAKIRTYVDAQPKFLQDIKNTFTLLGNVISSVGLVVASITIFIVIFINALTRRKFIGILKGIGINGQAIIISYILQSLFYALCGALIGMGIVYFILQPSIAKHPINFPFSDGILVAPFNETLLRAYLLMGAAIFAGLIPARMIVRRNTLDSILGRK
jgi:ABC-type lipoprotein release transport system permease subunit